mgnify:CR=1 FL=1
MLNFSCILADVGNSDTLIDIYRVQKWNFYEGLYTFYKLPYQFIWSNESKESLKKSLKSPNIKYEFLSSTYTPNKIGINKCVSNFENVILEASKMSLKMKKKRFRRKTNNISNKKWFDKECRIKRHELRLLANQKQRDPTNSNIRKSCNTML